MKKHKRSKKDNNHNEIIGLLSAITETVDMYWLGEGFPDGMCKINGGWQWFDVKNPATSYGRKGLNEMQRATAIKYGLTVYIIRTPDDAENFAKGNFDAVDYYPREKMPADNAVN